MRRSYQVAERKDSQALTEFLASEGQLLLPMVQLIEDAELAVDEVIDMVGRATIEAVLQLSAEQVAGRKQRGKRGSDGKASWHGSQPGVVSFGGAEASGDEAAVASEGSGSRR